MAKLSEVTKKIVDGISACPRMRFTIDEELIKDVARELKKRKTDAIAIPRKDFLKAFGRDTDDPTKAHSISYCINEQLRKKKGNFRRYGVQIGTYTDPKGNKFFKFKVVDWDDWDAEHTRTEEEE